MNAAGCALVVFVTGGGGPDILERKQRHCFAEHEALPMSGKPDRFEVSGADELDIRWRQEQFVDESDRSRFRTFISIRDLDARGHEDGRPR